MLHFITVSTLVFSFYPQYLPEHQNNDAVSHFT